VELLAKQIFEGLSWEG